ncbi:MAG: hypothetical protein QOF89_4617 [Acidobacteriota bacterium]|nr:hypothetical protein [Acidobacteriota bacterium]
MRIRPALPSDAATIADLATQLGYPSRPEETEARLRDVLSRADSTVLVAEDEDGTVIGYGHVFGAHRVDADPFAEIGALVVDERQRSQGIGAALVVAMEEWAAGRGYGALRVRSNVIRDRAHAFYERLGFGRVKVQQVFARAIQKGTFLEKAGELIGSVEGPGDLSTNKDHFKDYGSRAFKEAYRRRPPPGDESPG